MPRIRTKTVKLKVCLTPTQLAWLRKHASENYSTASGVVRRLIDERVRK